MTTWQELLGEKWWYEATVLADALCEVDGRCKSYTYPDRDLVFAAFDEVGPDAVSVVILGQDPYHSPGKARGVAFGYHQKYRGPTNSSLANIIQECGATPESFDRSLVSWTEQGVLLLNTRLTVPHEQPMGHAGLGWEPLMDGVLDKICRHIQPVVLAWGAEARRMANRSPAETSIDTSHPCRYSASRGNKPFLGSKCFERVNDELVERGDKSINWTGEVLTTHEHSVT